MKILIPVYPYTLAGFPMSRSCGGLFTATCTQTRILLDKGKDVTLLVPRNFPVNDDRVKVIRYDCPTKEECGQIKWTPFTEAIANAAPDFDRILLNITELATKNPSLRGLLKPYRNRMRIIQHHTDDRVFAAFFAVGYQNMAWILQGGGRAAAVSRHFDDFTKATFEKRPTILSSNPHHCPDLPTEYQPGVEWFNQLLVMLDGDPEDVPATNYILIARFDPEKKIDLGIQAFQESGVEGHLNVFVASPIVRTAKSIERWEQFRDKDYGDKVTLNIDAPRSEIERQLFRSQVCLFPSGNESFGLVPLEAASAGARVIHKCSHAFFLSDYDYEVERLNLKRYTEAIRNCPVPTLEERRSRRKDILSQASPDKFASRILDFLC